MPNFVLSQNISNCLGMSSDSWSNCFHCDTPGQCTLVSGGSAKDQLGAFRNRTLAISASNDFVQCMFLPRYPFSYVNPPGTTGIDGVQSLTCRYIGCSLVVNVSIDAKLFGLELYQPQAAPEIIGYNVTWVTADGDKMRAMLLVKNTGAEIGTFGFIAVQCCYTDGHLALECGGQNIMAMPSALITISPNETVAFESDLVLPSTTGTGGCDFKLVDTDNHVFSYTYVSFSMIPPKSSIISPTSGASPKQGIVSFIVALIGASQTSDQVLVAR